MPLDLLIRLGRDPEVGVRESVYYEIEHRLTRSSAAEASTVLSRVPELPDEAADYPGFREAVAQAAAASAGGRGDREAGGGQRWTRS